MNRHKELTSLGYLQSLSKHKWGRWAAETKTCGLELERMHHCLLVISTCKLCMPVSIQVALQGSSTKPPEVREAWGRGCWCCSFLILHAAWRCPFSLSWLSSLVVHSSHSSPSGCLETLKPWHHTVSTDYWSFSFPPLCSTVLSPVSSSHKHHHALAASTF